jgi:hypothetical protein
MLTPALAPGASENADSADSKQKSAFIRVKHHSFREESKIKL